MAGHFRGSLPPASKTFPNRPQFSGFMKPCRFEGEVKNLEIEGRLPSELNGTFYRVMPDPQFPPFVEDDPVSSPDGSSPFSPLHMSEITKPGGKSRSDC